MGLLDALLQLSAEPGFDRDLLFVPVGINYDRVLEDEALLAENRGREQPPGAAEKLRGALRLLWIVPSRVAVNLVRAAFGRLHRSGYVALGFGEPVSFRRLAAERGWDLSRCSDDERRAIAVFLSGKPLGSMTPPITAPRCTRPAPPFTAVPASAWSGWSAAPTNNRYQPKPGGALTAGDVSKLKLKWAFGFAGDTSAAVQPTIVDGRVFVGSGHAVTVLDARSGAVLWTVRVAEAVRHLAADPRTGHVFIAGDTAVSLLDARHSWSLRTITAGGHPSALAVDARRGRVLPELLSAGKGSGIA